MATLYPSTSTRLQPIAAAPYRQTYGQQQSIPPRPTITDDYERWYTENSPNNRMLLALRSEIDDEIKWALDRLCRLCNNEQFILAQIPGLTDALFEWPLWWVREGSAEFAKTEALFSVPKSMLRQRKHALESLFVLRNAAMNELNAAELASHEKTRRLILVALHDFKPDTDANTEFLLYVVELMLSISKTLILPPATSPPRSHPVGPLDALAATATDRSLIIASLSTLTHLLSNPANAGHVNPNAFALSGAIRYLPLMSDGPLVDACVNYLYSYLSHPAMTKTFLLHSELRATLRLLVMLILSQQTEEMISFDILGPVHTAPAVKVHSQDYELSQEEFADLLPKPEPQRCYEWMRTMFTAEPDGELTQVEVWNLYRETFYPYNGQYHSLAASDVIKNVSAVFPNSQVMVQQQQRYVVKGLQRRKVTSDADKFKCRWNRGECPVQGYQSSGDLFEHLIAEHIDPHPEHELACSWATCSHGPLSKSEMRRHVLTHLPSSQTPAPHPAQSDKITLPAEGYPHPIPNPTSRPPPPPREYKVVYPRPVADPSSSALTALLCIRLLFRAAFASSDAAPRADEDHFGFPGVLEDMGDQEAEEISAAGTDSEREGERRGRKAFVGIRHLLEKVRIRDETLMSWITEMVDAALDGTT
ncbi:hypothetical protein K474DRAFT_1639533 [Panus rudis PR-1116 ss-1]|nr:hypothetical protein K474DRAFT_1639533 [Panus rudis PR-1116 ss-1]